MPIFPWGEAEKYLVTSLLSKVVTMEPFLDNAAFAIRRELWQEVGPPEDRFSDASWGANYDYCWRARTAGWEVGVVRSAFVFHLHSASWNRLDPDYHASHAARMMDEMRAVWGDMAEIVSCRELVRRERMERAARTAEN